MRLCECTNRCGGQLLKLKPDLDCSSKKLNLGSVTWGTKKLEMGVRSMTLSKSRGQSQPLGTLSSKRPEAEDFSADSEMECELKPLQVSSKTGPGCESNKKLEATKLECDRCAKKINSDRVRFVR